MSESVVFEGRRELVVFELKTMVVSFGVVIEME
jgi:hypothetical protein